MVDVARSAGRDGLRVWWIGLPAQRAGIFRRVTEGGHTALGLEVMSSQQMYYRLLAGPDFLDLQPLVVGTARLVRVAEALATTAGALPSPGEVKLFAAAIAEAKRYGLTPDDVVREAEEAAGDVEIRRLATVFAAYQAAMLRAWDYDDVRAQAAALVAGEEFAALLADDVGRHRATLPDLVIVDGLREVGPLDLRVLVELGRLIPVRLTLPEPPTPYPGLDPERLTVEMVAPDPAVPPTTVERYLAPNVVDEARFVMRSLKRDLAEDGLDPLDLGVVATPGAAAAMLALAPEYGLPLMDEAPQALADTPEGTTLLDLLELAGLPTASRLLAIPDLAPLAAAALQLGVAGADAITLLARQLGIEERWHWWLPRLQVSEDPLAWTAWLLDEVLPLTHQQPAPDLRDRVMQLAQEAAILARGEGFAIWLAALLRDARRRSSAPGGISLLDSKLISGRRFKRLYVMGAVEGAYRAGEREDYFISEDLRGLEASQAGPTLPDSLPRLPRRFKGLDQAVAEELLSRAETTVVTAPEAGPDGTATPAVALFGNLATDGEIPPLPLVSAGSPLELGGAAPYRPEFGAVEHWWRESDDGVDAEFLRWYDQCAYRSWGEATLLTAESEPEPEWRQLLAGLTNSPHLTTERLAELQAAFPDFSDWLGAHAERLLALNWGPVLKHRGSRTTARVHAGERQPLGRSGRTKYVLYRFVEPAAEQTDWNWGREQQSGRWAEYLAAAAARDHPTQAPHLVEVVIWPLLGEPLSLENSNSDFVKGRLARTSERALAAYSRLQRGDVSPSPGYHCRFCPVFEACRVGRRT